MGTIRKSVLKKNKEVRRKSEGLPRAKSMRAMNAKLMKAYQEHMTKQLLEQRAIREQISKIPNITSHEDMGLPEEVDLATVESWKNNQEVPENEGGGEEVQATDSGGSEE